MKISPRFIPHLLMLGAYLALAVLMTYPLVLQMDRALPDFWDDQWKTFWNFWWVRRALLDFYTWPFHTPLLNAPTGTSLNLDQLAFFNDVLMLPVELCWGIIVAYNIAVLNSFVLSGYAGYLLNRYLLGRTLPVAQRASPAAHLAAFIGGTIFAFAPTQFGRVVSGGQTLMAVEWLALFILFTHQGVLRARFDLKRLTLGGLCLALGALCDWYQLLWGAFWLGLFAVAHMWALHRRGLHALITVGVRVASIAATGALLLSPILVGVLNSLITYGDATYRMPYDQYVTSSADLLAFITPPERHPLFGSLVTPLASRFTESFFEHTLFIGYVALLLVVLALRTQWRATRFWLVSALCFVIYILGPILHVAGQEVFYPLPFEVFYRFVPVVSQLARSVERGDTMVMLCLGIVATFGAYSLFAPRVRQWWAWCLPLLIAFEYLWIPLPTTRLDVPRYYEELAAEPGDFAIMHLPMEFDRPEDLFYQTVHGKRMTTGRTSRDDPAIWEQRVPVLQHFRQRGYDVIAQDLKTVAPTVLRDLGVRYIVIDYAQMPPPSDELYYIEDHGAELFGTQPPIYHDARFTVYAAPPVTRAVPYLRLEQGWGILDPENWGTLQAEGWRTIARDAGLTIIAPEAQSLRLRFKAKAAQPTMLSLVNNERLIGIYEIGSQPRLITSAPLLVQRGENYLTWRYDGIPHSVKLNSLDLQ